MNLTFNNIVDIIRDLPIDEKVEIKDIIEKSIIEENREKLYHDYLDSKKEYDSGKLSFSNDINKLKKMVIK